MAHLYCENQSSEVSIHCERNIHCRWICWMVWASSRLVAAPTRLSTDCLATLTINKLTVNNRHLSMYRSERFTWSLASSAQRKESSRGAFERAAASAGLTYDLRAVPRFCGINSQEAQCKTGVQPSQIARSPSLRQPRARPPPRIS